MGKPVWMCNLSLSSKDLRAFVVDEVAYIHGGWPCDVVNISDFCQYNFSSIKAVNKFKKHMALEFPDIQIKTIASEWK